MKISNLVSAVFAGFVGGVLSVALFQQLSVKAAGSNQMTTSGLYVMGADGRQRIQAGTYDGSYSQSEKGLPVVCLYDNANSLRLLFRLAGTNESPVIIFKDRSHRDRLVMGLDLNQTAQEPFIALFDTSGKKKMLTGSY